jgi:hypothetical protein
VPSPVSRPTSGSPKPAQRPAGVANSGFPAPPLKRKASGSVDATQAKIQRKDVPTRPAQPNGAARPNSGSIQNGAKPNLVSSTTTVPYRGTAGLEAPKPANGQVKKPAPQPTPQPKVSVLAPKPAATKPAVSNSTPAGPAPQKKLGTYLSLLAKAKEKDQTKPAAPPVKHEPTKIMNKKDRELARMEAKASKGKKTATAPPGKAADGKASVAIDKRKSEVGYQGTIRSTTTVKKPEIGYKGTMRPNTIASPGGRPVPTAAKAKPKPSQSRYGGYANWSDVEDEEEEEEEDDYASDASSDMEGNLWDVEKEETEALKAAKKEDAAALAEEERLKREKEERKRKLQQMNKAAAGKRKY